MTTRRALWALIGVSTMVRLVWAASLGGYANEAYYYMYARHLDWGFFDHPPMVGIVAAVGLALTKGLAPAFGLRLGFILMFAGSSCTMYGRPDRSTTADASTSSSGTAVRKPQWPVETGAQLSTIALPVHRR